MIDQAKIILRDVFGYEEFRPLQREIIENVLGRRDTLVIMPTGGGKSLCYQIPALLFKGLTVVVSPLISLMKDQVEQLTELGIAAVFLNSTLSYEEYNHNIDRIMRNEVRLLYVAPETLLMQRTLSLLSSRDVDYLTIDEAHCISEWGHDFRPEYRQLVKVRERFPKTVCVALTATATPRVQKDIKESLHFESSNEFIASFNRKNLFLQIVQKTHPIRQTIEFLGRFPNQSGIIYCFTRRQVDELTEILTTQGFSVRPYHAGLSDAERRDNQERFIRDDVQIMVATIAFGMGINKPNIRFILHYDLPKNTESYYQQIGRSGRDGLRAHCLLLFSYVDIQKIKYFINQKEDDEKRIANIHLNALIGLAETDECRRIPLLRYFGEQYSTQRCGMCDNCSGEEQPLVDVTIPAQKFLSCVKRTGEMFGAGHVIDVLRGSQAKRISKFKHHELSTYGIGKEHSKKQWFYLSRQFLQKGLLVQDMEFGSLKLAPKAWEVLRGKEHVFAKMEERPDTYVQREVDEETCDPTLFDLLKKERKKLADHANLPPYVIFPDKTLIEMATFFPQSKENLLQLHGVGPIKCEKYGWIFLDLISEYCQEHHIEEKSKTAVISISSPVKHANKRRHIVIGEEYNTGKSLSELQEELKIKLSTILNHLHKYISEGYSLRRSDEFLALSTLSCDRQIAVLRTFDRFGSERLKPISEALAEQVSYDELHLLRLYYLIENQEKTTW
jgi:ATP-dependent DNA helicase RecQ